MFVELICEKHSFIPITISPHVDRVIISMIMYQLGLLWCFSGKESTCVQETGRQGFNAWVGKILWRKKWQPASVFLPGKFHGQRSLAGWQYSPQVAKSWTQASKLAPHSQSLDSNLLPSQSPGHCLSSKPFLLPFQVPPTTRNSPAILWLLFLSNILTKRG